MTKRKLYVLIISSIGLILLIIGLTYAFFNYTRTGAVNEIVVGKIYMNYEKTSQDNLHLTNIFPSDGPDLTKYYEFKVYGYNEYDKDIIYDISLVYGDLSNNKERIRDTDLRFTLTRVDTTNDTETTLIDGKRYATLEDKRIYVDKIDKETSENNEIEHVYRLYMWIDKSDVAITDTPEESAEWINGRDYYSTNEWSNLEASIKVKVTGDFNEKIVGTPESCFTINVLDENEHTAEITGYNGGGVATLKSNLTQEQITACATFMGNAWGTGEGSLDDGETWEAFCAGTGTYWGDTFQDHLDNYWFENDMDLYFDELGMISMTIPNPACGIDVEIPSTINNYTITRIYDGSWTTSPFLGKNLTSVVIPDGMTRIGNYAFTNNSIKSVIIPNSVTSIGSLAFQKNRLKNVVLPNSIVMLGNWAFNDNYITSVIFPNSLTSTGESTFMNNKLEKVIIPNTITSIEYQAFLDNELRSITIPNSVTTIGEYAFSGNKLNNLSIPNSVTSIVRGAFNDNNLPDEQAYIYKRTDINNDGIAEIDTTTIVSYGGANKHVIIPTNVLSIGKRAFFSCDIISLVIPDSVTTIEESAFSGNQLTSVSIGNGINSIGSDAFIKYQFSNSNMNLTSITIDKPCSTIKSMSNYAWIGNNYKAGTTIYGSGGEVCDAY